MADTLRPGATECAHSGARPAQRRAPELPTQSRRRRSHPSVASKPSGLPSVATLASRRCGKSVRLRQERPVRSVAEEQRRASVQYIRACRATTHGTTHLV